MHQGKSFHGRRHGESKPQKEPLCCYRGRGAQATSFTTTKQDIDVVDLTSSDLGSSWAVSLKLPIAINESAL